ncbi:MAG TPA: restriction endonuclease [Telluria sp.]|nr:restriction endonuclease [Telluria sp.]
MSKTWMIRGEGGRLFDTFREQSIAAIGWEEIANEVKLGMSKKDITELYLQKDPKLKRGSAIAGAAQVWRFLNEIQVGDKVVTYSPGNRTYLLGTITGHAAYRADTASQGIALVRPTEWIPQEIDRDRLTKRAKNSLGSTLTVFVVPDAIAGELLDVIQGKAPAVSAHDHLDTSDNEDAEAAALLPASRDPLEDIVSVALERIKDVVAGLDWDEMQELVAGILRAMGYKTQVSPPGPDRGKDIVASPDGFGFEHPRIVVEVKHRGGQMDSKAIRSFLGGRHKDDRGLFVSTGGFSKDAYYEADRAAVPLTLWTMDTLVRALVEHYNNTDAETKRLVPLKRLYVPA